jgi:hypothetical protein
MRRIACVLLLLAGIPSALVAQVTLTFPRVQRPVVRAAVGPLTLVASIGKEGVKLGGTPRERATLPRTETRRPEDVHSSAASILATAKGMSEPGTDMAASRPQPASTARGSSSTCLPNMVSSFRALRGCRLMRVRHCRSTSEPCTPATSSCFPAMEPGLIT